MTSGGRLDNASIAELLARRGDEAPDVYRSRALKRAARWALRWEEEATEVVARGESPATLEAIGPKLASQIREWVEDPPEVPEPPEKRSDFVTRTEVRSLLGGASDVPSVRGDLQMHTTSSDGSESAADMAQAAIGLGYEYIALTDHTQGLKIAGGMDEAGFAVQKAEIDDLNRVLVSAGAGLRVMRSAEVNLGPRGEPDMERSFLDGLDLALGSFHSKLRGGEDQTQRYLGAIRSGINTLGHPRARMFDRRDGLVADWPRVFEAAAERGVALEIDSHPNRQDLQPELLALLAQTEAFVSIGTDAHDTSELGYMEFGVAAVIRAGIPPERIVNLWGVDKVLEWAREVRRV